MGGELQVSATLVCGASWMESADEIVSSPRKTPRSARRFSTNLSQVGLQFIQLELPKSIPKACRYRGLDPSSPRTCYRCSAIQLLQEVFFLRPSEYQLLGRGSTVFSAPISNRARKCRKLRIHNRLTIGAEPASYQPRRNQILTIPS